MQRTELGRRTKLRWVLLISVSLTIWLVRGSGAKTQQLPGLPGAALLVGYTSLYAGLSGDFLAVVTPTETYRILPEQGQPEINNGIPTYPSISADGILVGALRVRTGNPPQVRAATYSLRDKAWTDHATAYFLYGVAISPDKSELAFVGMARAGEPRQLQVLDMRTGKSREIPSLDGPLDGHLSWSPDGRYLAYQVSLSGGAGPAYYAAIDVLDLASGMTRRVVRGQDPAWSPSGEWIAYLDSSGTYPVSAKCMAVRPDGTGEQVLYTFPSPRFFSSQRYFIDAPVWSPDSGQLLLNELIDQGRPAIHKRRNIHLLDFQTHRLTPRFKGAPPVLGWAAWR